MPDDKKEPLFTAKGLAALAALACVYAAVLFGLNRDWVNWAAPLAFGGVLYQPEPLPPSVQLLLPQNAIPTAYLCSLGSLAALALLAGFVEKKQFAWLRRLKDRCEFFLRSPGRTGSMPSH